jgi:hypothetical protein
MEKGRKRRGERKKNKTKLKWPGNQIKKIRREAQVCEPLKNKKTTREEEKKNSLPGRTINRKSHFLFLLLLLPHSK